MSYGTVQAEKMTTESGFSLGAGNASSFKNRIINGNMTISQRSGTSSVSVDGANVVNPDRWTNTEIGDGAFTAQQVTDAPAGFNYSLKVTTTTVQTGTLNAVSRQSIEGFNIADLGWGTASAKSITLSFWVKSSLTGSFGGSLRNDSGNRCFPFSYTISSANTWELETITIPGDTTGTWATDNTTGVTVWFSHGTSSTGTAGAWTASDARAPTGSVFIIQTLSATWQVTGVQFEVGTVATSFDYRPYGTEYQLCLRYTFVWSSYGSSYIWLGSSGFTTSSAAYVNYVFPVQMRVTPTTTFSEQNKWIADYYNGNATSTAMSASFGTQNSVRITLTASLSANYPCFIANNGDAGTRTITFNSEL